MKISYALLRKIYVHPIILGKMKMRYLPRPMMTSTFADIIFIHLLKDIEHRLCVNYLIKMDIRHIMTIISCYENTYPDAAGFQRILLVDIANERINECVSIYSSAKHVGVERCDLHPRISKETNEVYFDADIDGHRRVYSFSLLEALENEA